MTAEMAEDLAETLESQPHIQTLILNDMSLTDEGVCRILKALENHVPHILHLEMALNEITSESAKVVLHLHSLRQNVRILASGQQ